MSSVKPNPEKSSHDWTDLWVHSLQPTCRTATVHVLPHLCIQLLPRLPLRLQFLLHLLQTFADKLDLCLATLQLHRQVALCDGEVTLMVTGPKLR